MAGHNKFGFILEELLNHPDECQDYLSRYLNKGHLGLLLGAGASKALGLPMWNELVLDLADQVMPNQIDKSAKYSNSDLKNIMGKTKRQINDDEKYLTLVKEALYKKVFFDFTTANTKLLTALSVLIIGKHRGNVQNIINYNFDCVLEWYLKISGMKVSLLSKSELLFRTADVYVTHIHGYLPYENDYGSSSDFLIFSEDEFVDRMLTEDDFWKDHLYEFFRRHVFLSIGLSANSLINDVAPYLRQLDKWYIKENLLRNMPYGFAFVSNDTTSDEEQQMLQHGIVPCKFSHDDIPSAVFAVAQKALQHNK